MWNKLARQYGTSCVYIPNHKTEREEDYCHEREHLHGLVLQRSYGVEDEVNHVVSASFHGVQVLNALVSYRMLSRFGSG